MITEEIARNFVNKWIESWNNQDLENILEHYSDKIEFRSPFISLLKFNDEGIIRNKYALRKYFNVGLQAYPNLHFKLHNYFLGTNTLVIYYTSVNDRLAAEVFKLNEEAKAVTVFCNYTTEISKY